MEFKESVATRWGSQLEDLTRRASPSKREIPTGHVLRMDHLKWDMLVKALHEIIIISAYYCSRPILKDTALRVKLKGRHTFRAVIFIQFSRSVQSSTLYKSDPLIRPV